MAAAFLGSISLFELTTAGGAGEVLAGSRNYELANPVLGLDFTPPDITTGGTAVEDTTPPATT